MAVKLPQHVNTSNLGPCTAGMTQQLTGYRTLLQDCAAKSHLLACDSQNMQIGLAAWAYAGIATVKQPARLKAVSTNVPVYSTLLELCQQMTGMDQLFQQWLV